MKALLILCLIPFLAQSQVKTFGFSPMTTPYDVNGVTVGFGHYKFVKPADPEKVTKINGFNLELNPFTPIILLFHSPFNEPNDYINMKINGLHISTGGFDGMVTLNGLGISFYSLSKESNGFTVTGFFNSTHAQNGLHIAGFSNISKLSNGAFIAPYNYADTFNGLAVGVVNQAVSFKGVAVGMVNIADESMTGIQIGLFNISKRNKGLQIGLFNTNAKRSLPLINW